MPLVAHKKEHVGAGQPLGIEDDMPIAGLAPVKMGTTIIALKYQGGVVLASDTRTSSGVVNNRVAQKITKIADNIFMLRAGTAADTQFVAQLVKNYLFQHQLELCSNHAAKFANVSVKSAASLARLITYNNKENIMGTFIIAGYDEARGPQVFNVAHGGAVFEQNICLSGSGSGYIMAYADEFYRPDFTKSEAIEFAKKLIHHATLRDGSSGGCIRYVAVDAKGAEEGFVDGSQLDPIEKIRPSM